MHNVECTKILRRILHFKFYILNSQKGFTLIELLIAISIVAIISSVGLVAYSRAQMLGRDSKRKSDLRAIAVALELYRQTNGRYPCSGWVTSSGSGIWTITDNLFTGACDDTKPDLGSSYISVMPKDPLNTYVTNQPWIAGNYIYGYYGYNQCTAAPDGLYYFLIAQLENANDPDRVSESHAKWCNGSDIYQNASSGVNVPSSFVISSY